MIRIGVARIVVVAVVLILSQRGHLVFGWDRRVLAIRIHGERVVHATPLMNAGIAALRRDGNPETVHDQIGGECRYRKACGQHTRRERNNNTRHKITPFDTTPAEFTILYPSIRYSVISATE